MTYFRTQEHMCDISVISIFNYALLINYFYFYISSKFKI